MKHIIKTAILCTACCALAHTSHAQLASDVAAKAAPVQLTLTEVKVLPIATASSTPVAINPAVKNTAKAAPKAPLINPAESQGKEIVKPATADAPAPLPVVSMQTGPAKKSD